MVALLKAARANPYLQRLQLLIRDNALGVRGAKALARLAPKNLTIASLDLADNELGDDGVAALCAGLCENSHLRHLNIDRCFKQSGKVVLSKRRHAIDQLKALLASDCPLESLSGIFFEKA